MSILQISQAEAAVITQRLAELKAEDKAAIAELAEATRGGMESTADNGAFDTAQDKKNLAETSLSKVEKLLAQATVVEADGSEVAIGTEVHCIDEDAGSEMTFKLAGDGAWLMDESWASARAPIGLALLGAKPNEMRRMKMGVRERSLRVISIKIAQK